MYSTEQDILKRIRKREFDKLVESISGEPISDDILSEAISTADSESRSDSKKRHYDNPR